MHAFPLTSCLQLRRRVTRRRNLIIKQTRQEIRIILAGNLACEVPCRELELVALGPLGGETVGLLLQQTQRVLLVDLFPVRGADVVVGPLPELAAGDFGGCGVLLVLLAIFFHLTAELQMGWTHHEVVNRHAANAAEPALHIRQTDVQVLADAVLGDGARDVTVKEIVAGDVDVLATTVQLVRRRHVLVEDFDGDGRQGRVGNPGAVVAGTNLAQLVGADALHGLVVGGGVVLDRDLRGHTALLNQHICMSISRRDEP